MHHEASHGDDIASGGTPEAPPPPWWPPEGGSSTTDVTTPAWWQHAGEERPPDPEAPAAPSPTGGVAPVAGAAPHRRSRVLLAGALVALGVMTGGAAGWVAGRAATSSSGGEPAHVYVPSTQREGGRLDVAGVLAVAGPSIASVHTTVLYDEDGVATEGAAAATGIVLTADGLLLTNAHVVEGAATIAVTLPGDDERHGVELVCRDLAQDLAVLQVVGVSGLTPATFADSSEVRVGDEVVAIGNALDLGDSMSVTSGIVSALDRTIATDYGELTGLIQTDAAISSGNSGGALLDASGAVIGISSASATSKSGLAAENIGFAICSNHALAAIAHHGVVVER